MSLVALLDSIAFLESRFKASGYLFGKAVSTGRVRHILREKMREKFELRARHKS